MPESDHNSFAEDVLRPGVVEGVADRDPRRGGPSPSRATRSSATSRCCRCTAGLARRLAAGRHRPGGARQGHRPGAVAARARCRRLELGLSKIVVEVVVDSVPAIGMFEALGFEPEALLRDHVRDKTGELHDLVVLAHLVEGTWSGMATAGFEDALT